MNIKKTFRIIFRNKTYSLLNIAGLAIGITSATLLFLWVESKVNFNRAFPNSKNVYIAGSHYKKNSGEYVTNLQTSNPLAKALENEFPEIKRSTRYASRTLTFTPENTTYFFEEDGAYADSTLFEMIGMTFITGSASSAFTPHNPVVISRSMARKLYDMEDPVGKGLLYEGQMYEVTGVFKDMPENITFRFEWLIPFRLMEQEMLKRFSVNEWGTSWMEIYVEPEPYADISRLNEKLKVLPFQKAGPIYEDTHNFLYPLNRVLLYGEFENGMETKGGYIRTVRLFFLIGILILLIACINFMNLSTARSQRRALEVGIRKTFGTKRKHLIRQFLIESGVITSIALLLSIGLTWLCLPLFNSLVETKLSFDFTNPFIVTGLIAIGLFCTFTAGSYPALYLSSFNPITTMKMQKTGKGGRVAWVRQGLVVFQFTMAFILICVTYVVYLQIRLVQNRDTGIKKENLVSFPVTNELRDSYSAVLNEVKNTGLVESCGFSSSSLLYATSWANPWYWNGKDPGDDQLIAVFFISEGLINAAGIKLTDGKDLDPARKRDVLINETLAQKMGEEGRIGGKLGQKPEAKYEITGIINDFIFDDPYAIEAEPAIFLHNQSRSNYLFVRLKPDIDLFKAIGHIQTVLRAFTPNYIFEPVLMNDNYRSMFKDESLIEKLSALFAALAIFISCLGLFGLSAFSAGQRTKEIGVRKVLGAKTSDILVLLGKAYITLLLISFAISIPISLYITDHYLKDYAYRIVLSWDIFVGVAFSITLIALLTVGLQSFRAAIANPVKSIKTE